LTSNKSHLRKNGLNPSRTGIAVWNYISLTTFRASFLDDGILRLKSRLDSAWRMCFIHVTPILRWHRGQESTVSFHVSHKGREKNSGAQNISVRQTREAQYFTGGSTWNNWDALTMDSVRPSYLFFLFVCLVFVSSLHPCFFSLPPFFHFDASRSKS